MHGPRTLARKCRLSSLQWCRDDDLFKRNFQFAKEFSAKNKKEFRLNFNPNPSARWSDGTREVNENRIGPINNFDGLLSHDADSKDAPTPPKQKKKSKASKPSAAPKALTLKPLKTPPPETSVQSEDQSRISKRTKKPKPKKVSGQALTLATVLRNEDNTIDQSSDEDLAYDALEQLIKSKQEAELF